MTKNELLKWYKSLDVKGMPQYINISDSNPRQVCYEGEWQNVIYTWGLCSVNGTWKYAETDSERGYVWDYREFTAESEACEYAKKILNITYRALKSEG